VQVLTPALERIIKDAVNKAIPQKAAVPTNDLDFDDLYMDQGFAGPSGGSYRTPNIPGKKSEISIHVC
jgi:hypothetical protein